MHVEMLRTVHASDSRQRNEVQVLKGAEGAEVEYGAQVDVKAFLPLPGEDLAMGAGEVVNGALGKRGVRRGGARTHVAWWACQVLAKRGLTTMCGAGHRIELRPVPARAVKRRDGACVVEERVRVLDLGLEMKPIRDVGFCVSVVVDVDRVTDVVAELEKVRTAIRAFERNVVRDQGDGVGRVG